jgi:hypothetical protein
MIPTEQSNVAEDQQIDILEDYKKPIEEVLYSVKQDECYTDMLEYLSYNGIFNLTDGRFDEWREIQTFIKNEVFGLHNMDIEILSSRVPPTND